MEEVEDMQESETASVVKVPREPAIIISGVPDLPPDCPSDSQPAVGDAPGSQVDPRFGEWLEGRKVRKLFGDHYYVGKVVKYESQSNWYSVVYEDGDQEDLEWDELEEILLPLDITIPLKTLVMDKCKRQSAVPDYKPKVGRPKKAYAMLEGTSGTVPLLQGTSVASNQTMVVAANVQQSSNVLGLLQVSASNDVTSASASTGENAQVCLKSSDQPRKRGRPRKDRTISGDIQPKKRGRPRKTPGDPQTSVHRRNAETIRAEKLKRENMCVQGATPGTQLF